MVRAWIAFGRWTVLDCTKIIMTKFWIDPEGNLIPVIDSHEEWANRHGFELEALLDAGWVRVQNVPPPYLLIDFHVPLTAAQAVAVRKLFEDRFEQVVIDFRGEARSFVDGEEAKAWLKGIA
jgi:hypothetical protein